MSGKERTCLCVTLSQSYVCNKSGGWETEINKVHPYNVDDVDNVDAKVEIEYRHISKMIMSAAKYRDSDNLNSFTVNGV